jgi:hypothetical protein
VAACAAYEPIRQMRYGELPAWVIRARRELDPPGAGRAT